MNPSSFSEEKLTAYALNELSPEERREVETELAANPELQAELESIQTLALQLRQELSMEAEDFEKSPISGEAHRSDLSDTTDKPADDKIIPFRRNYWLYGGGLLAAAACAALLAIPTISGSLRPGRESSSGVASMTGLSTAPEQSRVFGNFFSESTPPPPAEVPAPLATPAPMEASVAVSDSPEQSTTVSLEPAGLPPTPASASIAKGSTFVVTEEVPIPASGLPPIDQKDRYRALVDEIKGSQAAGQSPASSEANKKELQARFEEKVKEAETLKSTLRGNDAQPVGGVSSLSPATPVASPATAAAGSSVIVTSPYVVYDKPSEKALLDTEVSYAVSSAPKKSSPQAWDKRAAEAKEPVALDSNKAETETRSDLRRASLRRSPAGGESYAPITDNAFLRVADQALSTFSIDVDTGSYTNLRRFLNQNQLPPPDAVRIEEMVNYFNYNYPQPKGEDPFSVTTEIAKAPWKEDHLLVRIGLQGKTVAVKDRPAANLVFLIDVSGSMNASNKLPLVIESMKLLVQKLKPEDRVGIAVYAGNSGMVLPSTPVTDRTEIMEALSNLQAGGSTNGAMGIQLAYDMAKAHFIEGGINRVILCTDGDFNVGVTNRSDLVNLIEEKAKSKVFLSVFGFGMGNLQDATLEQLANKGNGNYGYIDNPKEAKRVFVDQVGGTLQTIAKDVKIQVEFNPAVVSSYRLIGYENRMLAAQDFNNDKKDAGEIGAGHRVTALYELIPVGVKDDQPSVDPLKYQKTAPVEYAGDKSEIMNVKLRYKQPEGDTSKLLEHPVKNGDIGSFTARRGFFGSNPEVVSDDFQFAAGVVAFGMILRDSPYQGDTNFDLILQLAGKGASGKQEDRTEFIGLVKKTKALVNPDAKQLRAY